jgi:hypothetical protein
MIDKIIEKLTDIGFVYKDTYDVHSGSVIAYIYSPSYLDNSHYRFTIIYDKNNVNSRNISIVLVNNETKAKATVFFSKRFFIDLIDIDHLAHVYSIIDETFKNEIRDFKLNKLLL